MSNFTTPIKSKDTTYQSNSSPTFSENSGYLSSFTTPIKSRDTTYQPNSSSTFSEYSEYSSLESTLDRSHLNLQNAEKDKKN